MGNTERERSLGEALPPGSVIRIFTTEFNAERQRVLPVEDGAGLSVLCAVFQILRRSNPTVRPGIPSCYARLDVYPGESGSFSFCASALLKASMRAINVRGR